MELTRETSFLIPYTEKLFFYSFHMRNSEKARPVGFWALGFFWTVICSESSAQSEVHILHR